MKTKWKIIMPLIVCIILAACACQKKEDTPAFTGGGAKEPPYQGNLNAISPSAYNNVQGLSIKPGSYISIIGKDNSSPYWKQVKKGVDQAAADLNSTLGYSGDKKIKVTYNAPSSAEDIDEQVNILDEELARYPDAVGIATIDQEACKVQFDLATENKTPIIALDSGNTYHGIQCTVETDNADAARTGAYKLCDEIQDEGPVLLIVHDSKSATAIERVNSFKEEIEKNHPNVKIDDIIYLDKMDDMKKAIAEEKNKNKKEGDKEIAPDSLKDEDVIAYYLKKYPDIKGCFGTSMGATQLTLSAMKQEKSKNIVLMGFDAGKEQLDALKSGDIKGLVVQNPFGIGYASVVAAARTVLQTGNEAVVNTGYTWVTQDNMKQKSIKSMLYE